MRQPALIADLPVLDAVAPGDVGIAYPFARVLEQLLARRRHSPDLRRLVHGVVADHDCGHTVDFATDLHEFVEVERRDLERVAIRVDETAVVRGPFLVLRILARGPSGESGRRARVRRNGPEIRVRLLAAG